MAILILEDATGIGSDDLNPIQAFVDMVFIANDTGIGLDDPVGGLQQVTYNRTLNGPPQFRLDALVNTNFSPDYGSGPQQVDIVVIPALDDFVLGDDTLFTNNGVALPPQGSGLPGATLNTTDYCLVIYDTQQTICLARAGTGGTLDLPITNAGLLYHEFSHAFRILNNSLLELWRPCNPSSPEENAAINDENDYRTQLANRLGETPVLRDPGIHCGQVCPSGGGGNGCCIIASLASGSPMSPQVQALRSVRDHFVRKTEAGFAFFERFFHDYYAFSPQVCTIMAGQPELTKLLMEGYIVPLLTFWQMMSERAQRDANIVAQENQHKTEQWLNNCFAEHHREPDVAAQRLAALEKTKEYWQEWNNPLATGRPDMPEELFTLLTERAWSSDYMQWALIQPVRIYNDLLQRYLQHQPSAESELDARTHNHQVGLVFRKALEEWTPNVPITPVWGALTTEQIVEELRFCSTALLQSSTSRQGFLKRLQQAFPEVTALNSVINRKLAYGGGV